MTQAEASYHRVPDAVPPPPSGCPVTGFTPFAADYLADPYAVLDGLRDTPVFYSSELGYLVVTRMEVGAALEEVLRYESPQTSWRRVANTDTEVAGVPVPAGTNIFMSLAAANHQPDIFDNPGDFDIHRPNARNHISFGKGIHFCLGARLARLEATVALEVLTERIPSLRLVEDQSLKRFGNITFRGPRELLVAWDA